jgi:hypothetical protein
MADHAAGTTGIKALARDAGAWLWTNRRKVATGVLVALPFVSRYFPAFPTDEIVHVVRLFLGA